MPLPPRHGGERRWSASNRTRDSEPEQPWGPFSWRVSGHLHGVHGIGSGNDHWDPIGQRPAETTGAPRSWTDYDRGGFGLSPMNGVPLPLTNSLRPRPRFASFARCFAAERTSILAASRVERPAGRIRAGMLERVGPRHLREAANQVRRVPAPAVLAGNRRRHSLAPLGRG